MNKNIRYSRVVIIAIITGILLVSCNQTKKPAVNTASYSCALPVTKNLNEAFSQSRKLLSDPRCTIEFEDCFENLLMISEGHPSMENRRKFSEFLIWANSQGFITMLQTRNLYNRYFETTYTSLPDTYNTSSFCHRIDTIEQKMQAELRDKNRGLMTICGDKKGYKTAVDHFTGILTLLDATCMACENAQ